MSGAGAGAMAGAAPYVIIETGRGVFLRPALFFGESLTALNSPPIVHALLLAARVDTCLRLPGLYTQNRGIQLDLCGGADLGVLTDSSDDIMLPVRLARAQPRPARRARKPPFGLDSRASRGST